MRTTLRSLRPLSRRVVLSVLGAALAAAFVFPWRTSFAEEQPEPLSPVAEDLNLGHVWANEQIERAITVKNASANSVRVTDVKTSRSCASLAPTSFTLAPGKSIILRVHLDFGVCTAVQEPRAIEFSTTVTPIIGENSGSRPLTPWILTATIRKALLTSPARLNLGDELLVGGRHPEKTAKIRCTAPVAQLTAESDSQAIETSVIRHESEPHGFVVRVKPKESAPPGRLDSFVRLSAVLETGEQIPPVTFPVLGTILGDVQATPAEAILGVARVGEKKSAVVTLSSRTGSSFEAFVLDQPDTGVKVEPLPASQAGAPRFRITVAVSQAGAHEQEARLQITKEDDSSQQTTLAIPVRYYGTN